MTLIDEYANQIFPLIRKCKKCRRLRLRNLPHECALIGQNYEHSPIRLLIIGKAPNADNDTREARANNELPKEYSSYSQFLTVEGLRFSEYEPLHHADHYCTISNILSQITNQSPQFSFTMDNITFTNLTHCYNKSKKRWNDQTQVKKMIKKCKLHFYHEFELLKPQLVIGLGEEARECFIKLGKNESNHLLTIEYHEKIRNADYYYTLDNTRKSCLFMSFYHPSYLSTYGRNKRADYRAEFDQKISVIVNFLRRTSTR
ncbi:uracil-DNA glycosylase family protein [Promethearchaeum syntrophicum]|uniref:Uracil-DNA glycosylase family protein n=1 Tax=Promethearchaeum syntrophicum TaxID=2594042 RepID=A0A5B9D6D1_9ARCH|nr:uracil-DNA glycosylase family protein [Candidatus Prometheoarchaeum syntrophicum]QEE14501.1 Uracil DNA glycosylase superfamily protein [Candidatus Prometheoarchaeum syntrophicum]